MDSPRSRALRRPLVDALERAAHERALVALRQPIGVAEGIDALLVRQESDRAGPVGAPQAAVDAEGVEDAGERVPDVLEGIGLARERAGAGDLDRDIRLTGEFEDL